jgi:hypothetical protein
LKNMFHKNLCQMWSFCLRMVQFVTWRSFLFPP